MDWTITITTSGPGDPADADALGTLTDQLASYGAVTTGTPDARTGCTWGATISLDITDPGDATRKALLIVQSAAHDVGLPWHGVHRLEVLSDDALDEDLAAPDAGVDLVGIAEVAEMLDITRQRASMLQTKGDFPRPLTKLASGPVWRRHDIEVWAKTWTRAPGRPKKVS